MIKYRFLYYKCNLLLCVGTIKKILCLIVISFAQVALANDQICFKNICFDIDYATSTASREQGLMYKSYLPEKKGLLFVFDTAKKHSFWMKNMLIPIDILWLDSKMRVVHIEENTPPCFKSPCTKYTPLTPALYALEIKANITKKNHILIGDKATLKQNAKLHIKKSNVYNVSIK